MRSLGFRPDSSIGWRSKNCFFPGFVRPYMQLQSRSAFGDTTQSFHAVHAGQIQPIGYRQPVCVSATRRHIELCSNHVHPQPHEADNDAQCLSCVANLVNIHKPASAMFINMSYLGIIKGRPSPQRAYTLLIHTESPCILQTSHSAESFTCQTIR